MNILPFVIVILLTLLQGHDCKETTAPSNDGEDCFQSANEARMQKLLKKHQREEQLKISQAEEEEKAIE